VANEKRKSSLFEHRTSNIERPTSNVEVKRKRKNSLRRKR